MTTAAKVCRGCDLPLPIDQFYVHSRMSDGHLNYCKSCVSKRVRMHRLTHDSVRTSDRQRYRANPERYLAMKRAGARAMARCPEARRAQGAVSTALHAGRLTRPSRCTWCSTEAFTEAAHFDYSQPLNVVWLCRRCHRRWDQLQPKTLAPAAPIVRLEPF
jgi:hypothetical protein